MDGNVKSQNQARGETSDYDFSNTWFNNAKPFWVNLFRNFQPSRVLEIGSFEGRSTVWFVENMLEDEGDIFCVDTWEGGEEHSKETVAKSEELFDANTTIVEGIFTTDFIAEIKVHRTGLELQRVDLETLSRKHRVVDRSDSRLNWRCHPLVFSDLYAR
jgi:hypothetical protein